jgi:guanylate kinase
MKKYNIVAICGKAGAGKDALLQALAKIYPEAHIKVSYTTRPPRDYEVDDKDYHFITRDEFIQLIEEGKMLEAAEFNGWVYGTSVLDLAEDKLNFGVFNPAGVEALDNHDFLNVLLIMCDCPDHIRLIRQLSRENTPDVEEVLRRYNTDRFDFSEFDISNRENTIIMRTDGSLTAEEEAEVLKGYIDDWVNYVK